MEAARILYKKLQTDQTFRQSFIVFVSSCGIFLVLGWNFGQTGPTLLDLQLISSCSLDEASLLFTAFAIGYLVSSFVVTVTFDRFDKFLHIVFTNIGLAAIVAAIPWCIYYEPMFTMHVLKGFTCGVTDAVVSTLIFHLFGKDSRTYFQVVLLSFTVGGMLSPLASSPFLTQIDPDVAYKTNSVNRMYVNVSNNHSQAALVNDGEHILDIFILSKNSTYNESLLPENVRDNSSMIIKDNTSRLVTDVYKAYTITAILTVLSTIPFIVMYLRFGKQLTATRDQNKSENAHETDSLPFRLRAPVYVIIFMTSAIFTAVAESFAGLLATFVVTQYAWTKSMASYVTSLYWGCFTLGSVIGIFIAPLFVISRFLCFYSFMLVISFVCLLASTLNHTAIGVWITAVLNGICMAIFYPLLFSWVEEDFIHITSRVTALTLVSGSLGLILNPVFLGQMMNTSPIWFCYILLGESIVLFLLFVIGMFLAKSTKQYRRNSKLEISMNVDVIDVKPVYNEAQINALSEITYF